MNNLLLSNSSVINANQELKIKDINAATNQALSEGN